MTTSWLDQFDDRLDELDRQQLLRRRRVVTPLGGARLTVDGVPLLAFCSNDYLGLAQDPRLVAAVHRAVDAYGVGAGASPMVSGFAAAADALERELAAAVGLPRALYFYAGFSANASIVPALVGAGDAVFSDALNHACLIDGARLSRAEIQVYRHVDLDDLDARLQATQARRRLIVSDAVFSMDGDLADLPALLALGERHDALVLLDDAHGFGVLGPDGRGALAAAGLVGAGASRRVLYMATLGKALGVAGAFVAGPAQLIEWLLQKTRSYTFATAAPPLLAEALRAALAIVLGPEGAHRRATLQARIRELKDGLEGIGWLTPSSTAIQPLVVGDNGAALRLTEALLGHGIWVPAIRPPTVPEGTARLRIALSAAHTADDVAALLAALKLLAEGRAGRVELDAGRRG